MMKILTVPNCITALRIVGAITLFFLAPLSGVFYIVYSLCGLSDVLDGFIARSTGSAGEFGAKLDSVADLLFYTAMLVKILPTLWALLPRWIWIAVGLILLVRFAAYLIAAFRYRRFASLHTYLNKLTGLILFAVPYFLGLPFGRAYCFLVCIVAALSSTEELIMHLLSTEYSTGKKSLLQMKR